jgi:hypothetical protein
LDRQRRIECSQCCLLATDIRSVTLGREREIVGRIDLDRPVNAASASSEQPNMQHLALRASDHVIGLYRAPRRTSRASQQLSSAATRLSRPAGPLPGLDRKG